MRIVKEFKAFAMKGNLIDIAIGFVMGATFKQVVTSFTDGIVSPLIGLLFKADFKDMKLVVKEGVADAAGAVSGEVAVLYGLFNQCYRFYNYSFYNVYDCKRDKQNEEKRSSSGAGAIGSKSRRFISRNKRLIS